MRIAERRWLDGWFPEVGQFYLIRGPPSNRREPPARHHGVIWQTPLTDRQTRVAISRSVNGSVNGVCQLLNRFRQRIISTPASFNRVMVPNQHGRLRGHVPHSSLMV